MINNTSIAIIRISISSIISIMALAEITDRIIKRQQPAFDQRPSAVNELFTLKQHTYENEKHITFCRGSFKLCT